MSLSECNFTLLGAAFKNMTNRKNFKSQVISKLGTSYIKIISFCVSPVEVKGNGREKHFPELVFTLRREEDRWTPDDWLEDVRADRCVKDGVRLMGVRLLPSLESRDTSDPARLGGRELGRDPGPLEAGRLPPRLPGWLSTKQGMDPQSHEHFSPLGVSFFT